MTLAVNTAQLVSGNGLYTDTSGNVGIGTASPSAKLDVAGSMNFSASGVIGWGGSQNYFIQSDNTNWLRFGTSGAERARIDSSGNLLVGNPLPSPTGANTNTGCAFGSNYGWVATSDALYVQRLSSDGTAMRFLRNATQVGSISVTASATTYATSSDYRLKENVQPMVGALAKVAALKPVTYTWKVDGSAGEGFVAHELAEVCPHAVLGEKDAVNENGEPEYQGIDTSFLVATLTAAIQEQQQMINHLIAKVAALEAK